MTRHGSRLGWQNTPPKNALQLTNSFTEPSDENNGCAAVGGRNFVSFNDEPGTANGKANGHPKKAAWRDHVFTAGELQRKTFPQISYCIPDLIPEGLTIIAGKPKIGKSWMALDICIAVAAGEFA